MKDYDGKNEKLKGKMVRVDQVILPLWAQGKHHFVFMNYLALEHPRVKSKLHHWIDLLFGDKQQRDKYYTLFKALTSEVSINNTLEICRIKRKNRRQQVG